MFYLSNWITKPVGDFMHATCEACGSEVFTLLLKRRRWISFLSIPLIPTSGAQWVHVCPECGAAWELPDDAGTDAVSVASAAESLLAGEGELESYHETLGEFVDEYGDVNWADAQAREDTRYIQ